MTTLTFVADWKEPKIIAPALPEDLQNVDVCFVVDNFIYKGWYNFHGNFIAKNVFASATGFYIDYEGKQRPNQICTHWCYPNELKAFQS